jgi:hypothetical protein
MDNMYNIEQDRTRKGIINTEQPDFSEKLQLQRKILTTSVGQLNAKQVIPWAAAKSNDVVYPISTTNVTEPTKYETEEQDKDYLATRNTRLYNSYKYLDPEEKFAKQFKRGTDLYDYQRPSVIRRPCPDFSPRKECDQKNLLLHKAEMMKLKGDILQKSGQTLSNFKCLNFQ